MRPVIEFSLELTSQELLTPPDPTGFVEVEDICELELADRSAGANIAPIANDYDLIEIELTAEEMDDLLSS